MGDLVRSSANASVAAAGPGARGRPIIVVVGMHRSGTSICAQMLSVIGVDMASEVGAHPNNPTGHFERLEIVEIQDEVLALFQRGYFSPTHDFPLPPGWWMDLRLRSIKDRIKAVLAPFLACDRPFGFKDPRTTRLMPLWNQIFIELGLNPRFVICLRDPAHVGVSLRTRDSLDREAGELRALDYLVDALRFTRGRDRCFIAYDDWLPDPTRNAMKLLEFVDLDLDLDVQDLEIAVQSLFREDLSRSGRSPVKARQPLVRTFYDLVRRFAESDEADAALEAKLDHFVHTYIAFRQLLRPFEVHVAAAIDARTAAERQLIAVQNDLATERATSARLAGEHGDVLARATQAESAFAGQVDRITELTTMHATAERELSGQLAEAREGASLAAAQAQQTLAELTARNVALTAALAASQAEQSRLAEAQQALEAERLTKKRRGLGARLFRRS